MFCIDEIEKFEVGGVEYKSAPLASAGTGDYLLYHGGDEDDFFIGYFYRIHGVDDDFIYINNPENEERQISKDDMMSFTLFKKRI